MLYRPKKNPEIIAKFNNSNVADVIDLVIKRHPPPDATLNPSGYVMHIAQGVRNAKNLGSANQRNGAVFELAVVSCFLANGIDEERITVNIHADKAKKAEVDIHVKPGGDCLTPYSFMLKTSCRERWKQCDRDCIVVNHTNEGKYGTVVLLFIAENPERDSVERSIAGARNMRKHMHSSLQVLTVRDAPGFQRLIRGML